MDYIYSTWPYIIKEDVLNVPRHFVIGSHPTKLPFNRGRHPLHWLISMGIPESYVSFFIMDKGIDSGNILIQERYSCEYNYGIQDVYENMMQAYKTAIRKTCALLEKNPDYPGTRQNENLVNYWRKRNIFDLIIDFRMRALDIERLVKSFNRPYECAVLLHKEEMIRIQNAQVIDYAGMDAQLERLEPGRVIWIKEGCIAVKTADKIVRLDVDENTNMLEMQFGRYIYPSMKYITENTVLYQKLLPFAEIAK